MMNNAKIETQPIRLCKHCYLLVVVVVGWSHCAVGVRSISIQFKVCLVEICLLKKKLLYVVIFEKVVVRPVVGKQKSVWYNILNFVKVSLT
jgi:hypothetical protein